MLAETETSPFGVADVQTSRFSGALVAARPLQRVVRALATTACLQLDGRTLNGSKRAEHTTIPALGPQQGVALYALVKVLTCVGRHLLLRASPTHGTGDYRVQRYLHGDSSMSTVGEARC